MTSLLFKTLHVFPSFTRSITDTLRSIQKHKITSLNGPPKFLFDLINSPELANYDTSTLKYMLSGSQIITTELIEQAFAKFKLEYFNIMYGMTELGFGTAMRIRDPSKRNRASFSIGKPISNLEFKVVDENGHILPLNTTGMLYARGFSIFKEYYEDEESTKDAKDEEGWLKTGDMVQIDENGYVFYINRAKEAIIIDDQQYFPSEVESILRTFDNIAEANVFSIGNGKFDIYACAWIILKDKSKHTSVDEIKSFCNKEVKLLLNYIKFVDTFPTSANGKVFKSELSSLYKNELNLLI